MLPKIFYGLVALSILVAAGFALAAFGRTSLPSWEQTAATEAAAVWYFMLTVGSALSAALWLAIGAIVDLLMQISANTRRRDLHHLGDAGGGTAPNPRRRSIFDEH